jgi:hypothetical protein
LATYSGAEGAFSAPDHEFPSYLELTLTVTDSGGLSDTDTVRLDPQTVILSFDSIPSGLILQAGSLAQTAPFDVEVIVGSTVGVGAPSPQSKSGSSFSFDSWTDGGAQNHSIVAGASPGSYVARYVEQVAGFEPGFLTLPGTNRTFVSAGDDAGLSVSSVDVRVAVGLDRASDSVWEALFVKGNILQSDGELFLAKQAGDPSTALFSFRNSSGVRFNRASAPGYVVEGDRWYRATLQPFNGDGGWTVTFWYSDDPVSTDPDSVVWTVHSEHATAGSVDVQDGTNDVVWGNGPLGNPDPMQGKFYYGELRSGVGGQVVADVDFRSTDQLTSTAPDYSKWTDSSGRLWTVSGPGWTYTPPS